MPQVVITKTLGRNIVEGQVKTLSPHVIDKISRDARTKKWYQVIDPHARRRHLREVAAETAKQGVEA
jgi:hypothetical protein